MRSRPASPAQLRVAVFFLMVFAMLLWAMAIFFPTDQIVVNGHLIKKEAASFRWWIITWRIMMGFGGVFSIFLALLCHSLARKKPEVKE
jgi:hypothetical protein